MDTGKICFWIRNQPNFNEILILLVKWVLIGGALPLHSPSERTAEEQTLSSPPVVALESEVDVREKH